MSASAKFSFVPSFVRRSPKFTFGALAYPAGACFRGGLPWLCLARRATRLDPMGITVDGEHYTVARGKGGFAHVRLADRSTTKCTRRHTVGKTRYETDLEMQTRAQRLVMKLNAEQERAQPLSACLTLGSPALSASAAMILGPSNPLPAPPPPLVPS